MTDQTPENIDPLKIAADLLLLKRGILANYDEGKEYDEIEEFLDAGESCVRQLFDENAKLREELDSTECSHEDEEAAHRDTLRLWQTAKQEIADLRDLVAAQEKLCVGFRLGRLPKGGEHLLDAIRKLKAKLGILWVSLERS